MRQRPRSVWIRLRGCGRRRRSGRLGGDHDDFALRAEIRYEIVDLGGGQHVRIGGHALSSVLDLMQDLRFVHALADELQVRTFGSSDSCGAMAVRATVGGEDFCAAGLRLGASEDR